MNPPTFQAETPLQARVLFGGIETAEHFGPRIRRWAARLGIRETADVTVLGDGADWIRNQAQRQLPGAGQLLDIDHASEHLSDCAKALDGEAAAQTQAWADTGRRALLTAGAAGVQAYLAAERARARSAARRAALDDAAGYFERRADSLG